MPTEQITTIRLILGDQLNAKHPWFKKTDKNVLYTMMEIRPESEYVTHHIHKIVGIFYAMRRFKDALVDFGHYVEYFGIVDAENKHSFKDNVKALLEKYAAKKIEYLHPDEYRLQTLLAKDFDEICPDVRAYDSAHFLDTALGVKEFFAKKKTYLMESYYRHMRKRYNVLMDGAEPVGTKWNYDHSNRNKLPDKVAIPAPLVFSYPLDVVLKDIHQAKLSYLGFWQAKDFHWALTRNDAVELLQHFIDHLLPYFGLYQDALSERSWHLFHSRISVALNLKLLHPLEVIQAVEQAYYANKSETFLAQCEGFIRQILGWREFMRGVYWANMPQYAKANFFGNTNPLPDFYWTANTKMQCVKRAVQQSLRYAYAHHIQRLMITGNFALLAGCHPDEVDAWYLGIYADAFEWVEMPNTRGMSQFADGGLLATKPYVSSASYIQKMGDHCKHCTYKASVKYGENACPFNSMYWNFIDQHHDKLSKNPRMSMMLALWKKMKPEEKEKILNQAQIYLSDINQL